jgi:preprotein translocase subunit SecG
MSFPTTFVTIVHVLLCVFMIFVILLQPGKDAGMGATLGGGAATSAFGGRGAVTFLSKVTAICATLFFLTSLGLSFVGMKRSVAQSAIAEPAAATTPATTGTAPTEIAGTDAGAGVTEPGAAAPAATATPPAAEAGKTDGGSPTAPTPPSAGDQKTPQ